VINGIDIIYIIPPLVLAASAILIGLWRFSKHGAKSALISASRVLVYGGFTLFVLFLIWIGIYYAGGGH
jgi:hypothetical protein